MQPIEIFAHDLSVSVCEDEGANGVLIIRGKDWESNPFELYVNDDEARSLSVQLGYQIYEREN